LVSASSDHSIRLWNFETRKVQMLNGHHDWIKAIALSPDGTLLASGSSDHTVKLWSLPDGKLCHTLAGHTREVNAIAFTTDSQILISGSRDRTIKLWRR
jgi:WD40 repeat protein